MEILWVLMVFLAGEIQDPVYFKDLDTCLEYSEKIKIKIYIKELQAIRFI